MTNNNWNAPQQYQQHPAYNNNTYSRYSRISIDDAMSIALERVPGEVVKVELDREHGRLVYEVDIVNAHGTKYEVVIDAQTGRIISARLD